MTLSQIYFVIFLVGPFYYLAMRGLGQAFSDGGGEVEEFEADGDTEVSSTEFEYEVPDLDESPSSGFVSEFDQGEKADFEPETTIVEHPAKGDESDPGRHIQKGESADMDSFQFSYFSLKIWSIVISAFGVGGYMAVDLWEMSPLQSVATGFLFSFLAWLILALFLHYFFFHSVWHSRTPSLNGKDARVVLEIPAIGVGQVVVEIGHEFQTYRARSFQNEVIPFNATVEIIEENLNNRLLIVKIKNPK